MKKLLKMLLVGTLCFGLCACSSGDNTTSDSESTDDTTVEEAVTQDQSNAPEWWSITGSATILPVPDKDLATDGTIFYNDDESLNARITEFEDGYFETYKQACIDLGFTVDSTLYSTDTYYYAYDSAGNKIELFDWDTDIDIDFMASFTNDALSWPTSGIVTNIPTPDATNGKITSNTSEYFYAQVCDFTKEDMSAYADECMEMGYTVDYSKNELNFRGLNDTGDEVYLVYQGFDICVIRLTMANE